MEIKFNKGENAYGLLEVKVSQADYLPEYNKQLKEYAKRVNIKGFRAGKAPMAMVEKMAGGLKQEVFNRTVGAAMDQHIADNGIKAMFQPMFKGEMIEESALNGKGDIELAFEVVLEPEFAYDLAALKVGSYNLEVSEQDVDNTIAKLKTSYPEVKEVESAEMGDTVVAAFASADGSIKKDGGFLELKEGKVNAETAQLFIGKKKGDTVSFDVEKLFDEEVRMRMLFGLKPGETEGYAGTFTATIEKINREQEPTLDQAFFDKVLGADEAATEEEFRTKLKEVILEVNQPAIGQLFNTDAREALMAAISMSFPQELLKKVLRNANDKMDEQQADERIADFEEAVKWRAISNRIAKDAAVEVKHADVEEKAAEQLLEQFKRFGMSDLPESELKGFVERYLQAENGKNYEQIYEAVFADKLFGALKEKMQLEENTVSLEQFEEILKAKMEKK